ncbi:hypothetical protein LTR02_008806 [Friedmanniomyces endolithicus]|nr:hypothetical protein LTR94_008576 [Friedmanniomyces endolithicus]KAK0777809.1 hypothetical protein LTR59_013726 [Friedmanniomyces endolithicus]KAK0796472.1 hypothetical protein LTR38_008521 [Friedmanniomyces endolithicus]KAK0798068.1 hypothetical protein LTR75_009654 [Friedmanniomyces endolithicus]KAK0836738.1 hypothetical protein LTR03_013424 [Friedmanniomyces endolithicus]
MGAQHRPQRALTEDQDAPSSSAPASSTPATDEPYVLTFGKHIGKTIDQVPLYYAAWLKTDCIAYSVNSPHSRCRTRRSWQQVHNLSDKDATSSFGAPGLQYYPQQDSGPAATKFQSKRTPIQSKPTPQSPPTVTMSPMTQIFSATSAPVPEGPYVLTFGKHAGKSLNDIPPDYIAWLKKGELIHKDADLAAAVADWDRIPRVYRLCFGKHKGCTLAEVPPTYLLWLQDFDAPDGHEDLKQALKDHKRANAELQVSSVQTGTSTTRKKRKAFDLPSDITFDVRRYYFNGDRKAGQMWIGCNDCVRYFGADAKAMVAAGLRPHHKNQRFWLHQVFAYAKHFGTTKGETPTKALNKFKSKNYNGSFYDSLGIMGTMV